MSSTKTIKLFKIITTYSGNICCQKILAIRLNCLSITCLEEFNITVKTGKEYNGKEF